MRGQHITSAAPCNATADDTAAIAGLHAQCFSLPWDEAAVADVLRHPGSVALVVRAPDSARLHGYIIGRIVADEAEILSLGIAEEARRLGHASGLVAQLGERAYAMGAARLYLEVAAGNGPAIALYQRLEFKRLGVRRGYYRQAGRMAEDALLLGRDLVSNAGVD
ncbi:MAG: ribosomal-protein-alanine N-acetyltransferase RimI [Hyphomicrobium sp.]|nr:MAG: ribosomal-protein-alanine N-acetyltransferase RimI [Hyphomicrobium sp.]